MGLSKKIELVANLAIIGVSCLLGALLVERNLTIDRTEQVSKSDHQGVSAPTVSSLDIDWRRSKQTLLLAVSSTCHFCTESAPFYKQLAKEHGNTRLIAVLPQSIDQGERYLEELGVGVDGVKQVTLSSINIKGTPTLILVDSDGLVVNTWVGKLSEAQQQEVLSKLRS